MEVRTSKTGIIGVLAGIGLIALGAIGLFLGSVLLIIMVLPGLFLIMIGITSQGAAIRGWGRGARTRGEVSRTGRKVNDPSEEDEKKRRDRESGAAD